MRLTSAHPATLAGIGAVLGLLSCAASQTPAAPDVHVTIACTPAAVNAAVNGWVVQKNPNSTVELLFTGGGPGNSQLVVTPKDANTWPFSPAPTNGSYIVADAGRLVLTVNANAAAGTYRYTIAGQCDVAGTPHSLTIDPDIVVN